MSAPQVLVHRDAELLAKAVAARLVTRLVDAARPRGARPRWCSPAAAIGTAVLAELAAAPARDAVDWRRLDIWWGDERFLPAGDPERNETGARAALLDHVDVGPGAGAPDAAVRRAGRRRPGGRGRRGTRAELRAAAAARGPRPGARRSTCCCSASGPEAHVASLFPGMPALYEEQRTVVAVRGVAQAAADPAVPDPAGHQGGPRGLDHRLRRGQGRRGPARAVRRRAGPGARPRAPAAASRRCSCSTGRAAARCPRSSAGSPRPDSSPRLQAPPRALGPARAQAFAGRLCRARPGRIAPCPSAP